MGEDEGICRPKWCAVALMKCQKMGSGCGSVGRAVASNTRDPRFKSSHGQKFIYIEHLFTLNCVLKRRK